MREDRRGRALPYSWREYPLKEIAKKVTRKNRDGSVGTLLSNTALHGVIRQADYFEKSIANPDNIERYYIVAGKDFVYNPRVSALAPYGPIHANKLGAQGLVSPLYTVFRLKESDAFRYDFLRYYFESSQWHKHMHAVANHGARHDRMHIANSDFFALPIALPPVKEQEKIIAILSHCDRLIELKQQRIQEESGRKTWMTQNLLDPNSGLRLPGFTSAWSAFELGANGVTYEGLAGKSAEDFGSGKPYIPYLNIFQNVVIDEFAFDYVRIGGNEKQNKVRYGDIFFTSSSETAEEVGVSAVYLGSCEALYLNSFSFGYRLKSFDKLLPEFAAYYFNCTHFKRILYKLAQGGTRYNLSKTNLMKQWIYIPPSTDEQRGIVELLAESEAKTSLLEQELGQWKQKKKALLQALLTGRLRVLPERE